MSTEKADLSVIGTIHSIGETKKVSDKMSKRELILLVDGDYPQHIKFEMVNAKCDIADFHKAGDNVKVCFNLQGRLWKKDSETPEVCFTTLNAWRIEKVGGNQTQAQSAINDTKAPPSENGGDDLPF